ncbi:MAG TPA: EamA family transporter [Gemmatimonadales bacterium]|nr:EamA family transporter [Gemmatimonadales bacterium]
MTRRQAVFTLWTTCLIWGTAFPLAKLGLRDASPMAFSCARFVLASALLLPMLRGTTWEEWRHGAILALLLSLGFGLQTIGLNLTTPSRSGFITALYLVFVPVILWAIDRSLPDRWAALALVIALTGMFLLTRHDGQGGGPNLGDFLTLLSSISFAAHLVATGAFARRFRIERLMIGQIIVSTLITLVATPILETPRLHFTPLLLGVIAYEAVLATVVAIPMQLAAQRVLTPTHTALIFTLEPVVAALASMLLVGELLTPVQWFGGLLILGGSLLPELGNRLSLPASADPAA